MAENREYISRPDEMGTIHISEEVLAVIAAAAALEVEGVGSMAANLGSDLAELLGKKNMSKGIRVRLNGEAVVVDISMLIKYGHTVIDVAKQVQDAVVNAVEATSGLPVEAVNVHVGGVTFEKEHKTAPQQ